MQNPVKGELWRQGAIPDRHLDSGRQEGEGRTGPDEGVVVLGLACDLGERRSGPERREPTMRTGKRAEQRRIRVGFEDACHQFRLDAAAADMNWCRQGAEIGRKLIRWHIERIGQNVRIKGQPEFPWCQCASDEEVAQQIGFACAKGPHEFTRCSKEARIGPEVRRG